MALISVLWVQVIRSTGTESSVFKHGFAILEAVLTVHVCVANVAGVISEVVVAHALYVVEMSPRICEGSLVTLSAASAGSEGTITSLGRVATPVLTAAQRGSLGFALHALRSAAAGDERSVRP
jgi:hypothetical protein